MKDIAVRVGSAVVASLVAFAVTQFLPPTASISLKALVVVAGAVAGFALAVWGTHGAANGSTTSVASNLSSAGKVTVRDVDVTPRSDKPLSVASDIVAEKDILIDRATVRSPDRRDG